MGGGEKKKKERRDEHEEKSIQLKWRSSKDFFFSKNNTRDRILLELNRICEERERENIRWRCRIGGGGFSFGDARWDAMIKDDDITESSVERVQNVFHSNFPSPEFWKVVKIRTFVQSAICWFFCSWLLCQDEEWNLLWTFAARPFISGTESSLCFMNFLLPFFSLGIISSSYVSHSTSCLCNMLGEKRMKLKKERWWWWYKMEHEGGCPHPPRHRHPL